MDIVQHGAHSVILSALVLNTVTSGRLIIDPWMAALFFIIGAMPDLTGWFDGLVRGEKYRWNGMYKFFHEDLLKENILLISMLTMLTPGLILHILIDKLFHKPDGGWIDSGLYWDIIGWVITVGVGYFLFFY